MDFVTQTKGSFDDEHFVRVPYEEASELVAHKIAHYANTIMYFGHSARESHPIIFGAPPIIKRKRTYPRWS